jgi:hypothetical protein
MGKGNYGHRFMASAGNIYGAMQQDGLLKSLFDDSIAQKLEPLRQKGWKWDQASERLVPGMTTAQKYLSFDTPWCHAKGTPLKHCTLDHMIIFNTWGIIPKRCQHCWKVVVAPDTVEQLFQLEQLELQMDVPCKCGIELRDYTPRHYGGYFYNNSIEEGRDKYELVRTLVDKEIKDGKDISVILKRGCTEFELLRGPSPFWHTTQEDDDFCETVDAYVEIPRQNTGQCNMVKNTVRIKWLYWAFANGDKSYKVLNGGKDLYAPPVLYHKGDIDGIKADLASARANALGGVDSDTAYKFLENSQKLADEYKVDLNQLKLALGDEVEGSPVKNVPYEMIGEQDQTT